MIDFIKSNNVLVPDLSYFNELNTNMHNYSDNYIMELREALKQKYKVSSVYLNNGSSPIIEKLIFLYNNFYIQKQDFYLFKELLVKCEKQFEEIQNVSYLEYIKSLTNLSGQCVNNKEAKYDAVCLFTLVNNQTGLSYDINKIVELAKIRSDILFIIDGAYREYSNITDDEIKILSEEPNIVYLGTFSKAYGLAGFRVGYLIGAEKINLKELPFSISNISALVATRQLSSDFLTKSMSFVKNEQNKFMNINGFFKRNHKVVLNTSNSERLYSYLIKKQMRVGVNGLNEIVISMNSEENNHLLIEAISSFMSEEK